VRWAQVWRYHAGQGPAVRLSVRVFSHLALEVRLLGRRKQVLALVKETLLLERPIHSRCELLHILVFSTCQLRPLVRPIRFSTALNVRTSITSREGVFNILKSGRLGRRSMTIVIVCFIYANFPLV